MALVGSLLNKAFGTNVTAADQAAGLGYVGINIDTTVGNTVLIDGLEFFVLATGADYNNLLFTNVQIVRDLILNPAIPLQPGNDTLFTAVSDNISERGIRRNFTQPIVLDKGFYFGIFGQAVYSAFVGPVPYAIAAYGRNISPGSGQAPIVLR